MIRLGVIQRNVCDRIDPPRMRHHEMTTLSEEQARLLLTTASGKRLEALISYAQEQDLAASLAHVGYTMRLVPSPGKGYHHAFAVLYDASRLMLHTLPQDAADALSRTFKQRPTPHRVQ